MSKEKVDKLVKGLHRSLCTLTLPYDVVHTMYLQSGHQPRFVKIPSLGYSLFDFILFVTIFQLIIQELSVVRE